MTGVALLFPGQGSQAVGMGRHLWEAFPEAREVFEEGEDILSLDLRGLCLDGPLEELTRTDRAQPAIFVCSVAAWRVLQERGVEFTVSLGHSMGEYSALVATGQMSFADALKVVAARGDAMYRCGRERPGTMAAVLGMEDAEVEAVCADVGEVWPANYNSPGQVVVSGSPESVTELERIAVERGARRVLPLEVSGAFHSPLVAAAAGELESALDTARITEAVEGSFFSTTEVRYPSADEIRDLMVRQLTTPVRFTQSLQAVIPECTAAVEVGPGGVLGGLLKRVDRRFPVHRTDDSAGLQETLQNLSRR